MALKHVVLAVIAEAPSHGYEIHARLGEILPVAWRCDRSRVYGLLAELEREGWLTSQWENSGRGRPRKRYRLGPGGEAVLLDWLERPRPAAHLLRRPFLLRMALIGRFRPSADVSAHLARWQRATASRMRRRADALGDRDGPLARLLCLRDLAHLEVERAAAREFSKGPPG